jgi:hypothetical protein
VQELALVHTFQLLVYGEKRVGTYLVLVFSKQDLCTDKIFAIPRKSRPYAPNQTERGVNGYCKFNKCPKIMLNAGFANGLFLSLEFPVSVWVL